jgi:hypothetical protein
MGNVASAAYHLFVPRVHGPRQNSIGADEFLWDEGGNNTGAALFGFQSRLRVRVS